MMISAIVPAAGCGARAALNGNKILAPLLHGFCVLEWTLNRLRNALYAMRNMDGLSIKLLEVIVVARAEEFPDIDRIWKDHGHFMPSYQTIEGGATRQDSVHEGVKAARGDLVLIHDAARPCISSEVVQRTVIAAMKSGAAIAALPVSDTVKRADGENFIQETLNRSEIWLAQTPQVFQRDLFLKALENAQNAGFAGTDCASIMEWAGHKVALVEGDVNNLKVTYAADLQRAAAILRVNSSST